MAATDTADYVRDAPAGIAVLPDQASTIAGEVDLLFWVLVAVCTGMVLLILGLIAVFCWRYREGADVARPSGSLPERQTLMIEAAWTAPVIAVFLILFYWGAMVYARQYGEDSDAVTVNVIGKQWMWKAEHHGGVAEINELHVPVGERIRVRLTSQDVIHSFSIPAFRLKRDAVPQRYTSFTFTATRPGVYSLFCTEFCGTDHSRMRGRVVAMTPADFEAWLAVQDVPTSPAQQGERLFIAYGCSGCHTGDSTVHAPGLAGLYGRPVQLAGGGSVVADHDYIRDSILLPQKHLVAGYRPVMPSFQGQIPEGEILKIIAYLQSLGAGSPDTEPGASR